MIVPNKGVLMGIERPNFARIWEHLKSAGKGGQKMLQKGQVLHEKKL